MNGRLPATADYELKLRGMGIGCVDECGVGDLSAVWSEGVGAMNRGRIRGCCIARLTGVVSTVDRL